MDKFKFGLLGACMALGTSAHAEEANLSLKDGFNPDVVTLSQPGNSEIGANCFQLWLEERGANTVQVVAYNQCEYPVRLVQYSITEGNHTRHIQYDRNLTPLGEAYMETFEVSGKVYATAEYIKVTSRATSNVIMMP